MWIRGGYTRPLYFWWLRLRHHFKRRSFFTEVTPATPLATLLALSMLALELTKPLNCTTPLKVSTLISADLSSGSENIAEITLVVTTESSIYSPVHSLLAVEAQPMAMAASNRAATKVLVTWLGFFMTI